MKYARRRFLHLAACSIVLPLAPRLAKAQASYPTHPVRLIVGYPAGGQIDIVARVTAQWLGEHLGQTVVVENKPGAGGNLGAEAIVNAPPEGYTLFFAATSNAINTSLFASLPYDFIRDTAPVAPVNRIPLVLESNPSFQAKDTADLIALAKANPGKVNLGSPSAGTPPYMAVELFKMMSAVNVVHVPYFGESQMVTDLLGGQLMVGIGGISAGIGQFQARKLRAMGVTTAARVPELPDVPTIGEAVPGFEASGWSGIVGPKELSAEIIDKLHGAVADVQADPKFRARLSALGVTPFALSPAEFGTFIAAETEKWRKVVKFAGLKPR